MRLCVLMALMVVMGCAGECLPPSCQECCDPAGRCITAKIESNSAEINLTLSGGTENCFAPGTLLEWRAKCVKASCALNPHGNSSDLADTLCSIGCLRHRRTLQPFKQSEERRESVERITKVCTEDIAEQCPFPSQLNGAWKAGEGQEQIDDIDLVCEKTKPTTPAPDPKPDSAPPEKKAEEEDSTLSTVMIILGVFCGLLLLFGLGLAYGIHRHRNRPAEAPILERRSAPEPRVRMRKSLSETPSEANRGFFQVERGNFNPRKMDSLWKPEVDNSGEEVVQGAEVEWVEEVGVVRIKPEDAARFPHAKLEPGEAEKLAVMQLTSAAFQQEQARLLSQKR